jgi:hypothetical protein
MEQTYFQIQLDRAIKEAEKLLKQLNAVKSDYADKRMEDALEKSVSAARIAESVTLKTRALPAHTGHPQADAMVQNAIEEAVPVEMGFTEKGWFSLRMPILLPRKEKSSRSYLRGFLYPALEKFSHGKEKIRYRNCVLIFRHVYDRNRPEREYRDHDNIELNTVVDAIAMFFLVDDTPFECRHYYCSTAGDEERTEVYIVPRADFESWLGLEKEPEKLRKKLYKNLSEIEEK